MTPFRIHQLASGDFALMHAMLAMFGEAFEDVETYGRARPRARPILRVCSAATRSSRWLR